ncbi:MAG: DUF4019 domain-containing protein [Acidobacteria bacterium]|nr:DUF4019 domain-containing protein [Acidobacteriota bacterium]
MLRKVGCLIAICVMLAPAAGMAQNKNTNNNDKDKAAVTAAEKWLSLVDQGKYAESWKDAGTYLRNAVTEEKLVRSLEAFRKPLGKLVSRRLKTAEYKTSLPGAPNGQYVVMQFETSFTNKTSAIETVTDVLDKNGTWRVIGYYIK